MPLLTHLCGESIAKELIFTAKTMTGREAHNTYKPLITHVSDNNESFETAAELAIEVTKNAPLALRATKRIMLQTSERSFQKLVDAAIPERIELSFTDDHREALNAFAEKRAPKFTGT